MNNTDLIVLDAIMRAVVTIGTLVIAPFAVKAFKRLIGEKDYAYLVSFLKDFAKLHPEAFTEANIENLLQIANQKFGNKISNDTIVTVINIIIKDLTGIAPTK